MSRKYHRSRETYVVGSNAIALDHYEEAVMFEEDESVITETKLTKVYSINPACTFLLVSVIIAMILICVVMLKTQFSVADTSDQIIKLKNELNEVRRSNAQLTAQISEELDLVDIRRTAMEEYGMVYPSSKDILDVNPEASSYTIQYTSIETPKEDKMTIGNMMAFITRGW
jgi:hypothetical protein